MNEEEAIERLKYIDMQYNCNNYYSRYDLDCIETVLNLLEKKDRTIQQLKDENKTLNKQAQQYFETTIIQSQKYDEETTKKDKMIELMLEEISKNILNTCPFADYNVDLDCENKCKDDYKACWKQYYERKVEND